MLDVGNTQLLASVCGHATLQLVEEVRPRARVRHFPGDRFFLQASKSEELEMRQFGCNGFCDPRCRPPVSIASATLGRHWLCLRIGRLRSTAVGCLRSHSSVGDIAEGDREKIILAHQWQPRCREQERSGSTRLRSASAVRITSWWRPHRVARGPMVEVQVQRRW